jgi:hypothetical protein
MIEVVKRENGEKRGLSGAAAKCFELPARRGQQSEKAEESPRSPPLSPDGFRG